MAQSRGTIGLSRGVFSYRFLSDVGSGGRYHCKEGSEPLLPAPAVGSPCVVESGIALYSNAGFDARLGLFGFCGVVCYACVAFVECGGEGYARNFNQDAEQRKDNRLYRCPPCDASGSRQRSESKGFVLNMVVPRYLW